MLYALNEEDNLRESISDAIQEIRANVIVNHIAFDAIKKSYYTKPMKTPKKKKSCVVEKSAVKLYNGLTEKMKKIWNPILKFSDKNTLKNPSSKEIGKKIHAEINEYLKTQGKSLDASAGMTKCILKLLRDTDRTIIASEVPCRSTKGEFITQADLIVMNAEDEIELIEIKTGQLPDVSVNKENITYFNHPLDYVEYSKLNEARLQLVYTGLALEETIPTLKVDHYVVVNVYVENNEEKNIKSDFISSELWMDIIKNSTKMEKRALLENLKNSVKE